MGIYKRIANPFLNQKMVILAKFRLLSRFVLHLRFQYGKKFTGQLYAKTFAAHKASTTAPKKMR